MPPVPPHNLPCRAKPKRLPAAHHSLLLPNTHLCLRGFRRFNRVRHQRVSNQCLFTCNLKQCYVHRVTLSSIGRLVGRYKSRGSSLAGRQWCRLCPCVARPSGIGPFVHGNVRLFLLPLEKQKLHQFNVHVLLSSTTPQFSWPGLA